MTESFGYNRTKTLLRRACVPTGTDPGSGLALLCRLFPGERLDSEHKVVYRGENANGYVNEFYNVMVGINRGEIIADVLTIEDVPEVRDGLCEIVSCLRADCWCVVFYRQNVSQPRLGERQLDQIWP